MQFIRRKYSIDDLKEMIREYTREYEKFRPLYFKQYSQSLDFFMF